jgi:hypothetical protein
MHKLSLAILTAVVLVPARAFADAPEPPAGQTATPTTEPATSEPAPSEPVMGTTSAPPVETPTTTMEPAKPAGGLSVTLNQDTFFGFNPAFQGTLRVTDALDLSYYGIFWTRPALGQPGDGSNLWTEFGLGVSYAATDYLKIIPQIGITNGTLLSSAGAARRGGVVADGVVPNLTVNLDHDAVEGQLYAGYYKSLRDVAGTNDFLHFWLNAGPRITKMISIGAHYEHLALTRTTGGDPTILYQWVGGYLQFRVPNTTAFARFTGGANIGPEKALVDGVAGISREFYKLSVGFGF